MTDNAFAAAAAQASTPASNPTTNPLPFNTDNPFGAPSEQKGGVFTPTPGMEYLAGRTLVYIPRTFDANAKDPFDPSGTKTRKQWTCDLYVIDGGDLRFWYTKKDQDGAAPEVVEHVHENTSPATPYVVLGQWVSQAAFVGKLSAVAEKRQILVCQVVRGAQKAQRDKGMTDEKVQEAYAAWVARGKMGEAPKFVWVPVDATAEGMANASEWYRLHKDSIKL